MGGDVAPICQPLEVQMMYLESFQQHHDTLEQKFLREHTIFPIASSSAKRLALLDIKAPVDVLHGTVKSSAIAGNVAVFDTQDLDEAYITQLDRQFLLNCVRGDGDFGVPDGELPDMVEDEQIESDDPEILSPPNTLLTSLPGSLADLDVEQPRTDALNNTYVRIVHINGMHHILVLRCGCHGEASVPADLVARG
ncbi:hypothetical protein DXG01_000392 [Tephrocybe rancida]|nr:hypothetical protein DXG01_000392 [Tephrocybe rancida]